MRVQIGRSSQIPTSPVAQPQPTSTRGPSESGLQVRPQAGGVEPGDVFTPHEAGRKLVELSGALREGPTALATASKPAGGGEVGSNGQRIEWEDHSG